MIGFVFKGLPDNVEDWRRELLARIPELDMRVWPEIGDPDTVDVALMWRAPHGEFGRYPNLKAILNLGVGVDTLFHDPDLPRDIPIARMVDPTLNQLMATYVLHAVIGYHRGFATFAERQKTREWIYQRPPLNARCRVGIMGLGVIGTDIARTLLSLGFTVSGWSRRPKEVEGVTTFAGADEMKAFLGQSDILVCILPLTEATRGMLDAEAFAALPRGAKIVNIARGAVVDEAALLDALDSGQVGGATLDVFATEPLPQDSRFWTHPSVTVTPHIAASTTPATAADQVAENIRRACAGKPLLNQVDLASGY
ncbi:2-hydroxyacid dehydrogenase [Acuticoccus kandeliae]|uniref:2-hydroxyacid dehydrogenase n=1 Tax=Acuticoccus kandeliae TaxID=2073160 RepID=UPI00196A6D41|nr:glyoxylate/hydroxypyruvate reductase A [Acuticoccus kandeliae]